MPRARSTFSVYYFFILKIKSLQSIIIMLDLSSAAIPLHCSVSNFAVQYPNIPINADADNKFGGYISVFSRVFMSNKVSIPSPQSPLYIQIHWYYTF